MIIKYYTQDIINLQGDLDNLCPELTVYKVLLTEVIIIPEHSNITSDIDINLNEDHFD